MPFKSEKQRRYLWLKHPDIAKRWADTYPTKKDLPMYADDSKATEKQSTAAQILNGVLPNYLRKFVSSDAQRVYDANIKKSDSKQEYVKLPMKHGPTCAGESDTQAVNKPVEDGLNDNNAPSPEKQDQVTADALFKKLAVVLSPVLMQEIEDEQARQQARDAQRMPTNVGVKHTPPAVNSIMPPMGMAQPAPNPGQTQPAQPAQPQQPQQPANGQLASVGGGASPNANPINAFGGLSSTGDINGNAALGTQNMAGGEKMSAGNDALAWLMSMDNCNAIDDEDLDYDERAKRAATCSCRKPGGSCYVAPVKKAGLLDFLTAPKLEKLETSGALPQDNKIYDWPRGQGFGAPYATAGGIPKGYKYLGTDHDGNSVLQGPDGKPVSMFHETGDLSRPTETVAPPPAVSVKQASSPAWQRSAGKNDEGGLNAKGRASYNKATGGNLKAPVTESKPSGSRAKRQNSFCSRMCGMKKHETGADTKKDPESRINKALRKWNCKCGNEKTAVLEDYLPNSVRNSNTYLAWMNSIPAWATGTTPAVTAAGALAGAGYGGVTGTGVVRNALRGSLIGAGSGLGNIAGSQTALALHADINSPDDHPNARNSYMVGSTAGTLGGAYGGNQLYNVLERMYDKHRAKKKPEKQAQDFDPALSRDAENAVMHGTGLVGSGVLGSVAGLPVSAGLEHVVRQNNLMPDSDKSPWRHMLAQMLVRTPIVAGGMLGTRLYDNYILRPHMKREMERKQQEEAVRAQLMKKQADVSLQRVLGTALASTGGGLLLGSYPGWKLQRASEAAGNSDFTNFVAGKAPIALSGALSAGLYNHWLDSNEKKPKKEKPENPAHPSMQYLKYLVH